ncbi:hypothetical protein JD974_17350 [Chromobacterium haemolyticum]|uniref:Phage tail tape measure protein n=1 Tax=Chromobacterium haemolyticum TaxID=394935 RepID=A0ABS3GQP5_9NEIS|nr:hypothetical protein [Chromobacterium haemolyticum]MBK0416179.1 hypothetical protein [Chromobacterium haemolyticum]MBO0417375.1 hypothetical protein [Chromobacterium haemolyticum]MBO0500490.1 hypothetical protein [Chromobacterium haemolyticum]
MVSEFFIGLKVGATLSGVFDNAFRSARASLDELGKTSLRLRDRQRELSDSVERSRKAFAALDLPRLERDHHKLELTLDRLRQRHDAWLGSAKRGQGVKLALPGVSQVSELVAKCRVELQASVKVKAVIEVEQRVLESQERQKDATCNPRPPTVPKRPTPRGDGDDKAKAKAKAKDAPPDLESTLKRLRMPGIQRWIGVADAVQLSSRGLSDAAGKTHAVLSKGLGNKALRYVHGKLNPLLGGKLPSVDSMLGALESTRDAGDTVAKGAARVGRALRRYADAPGSVLAKIAAASEALLKEDGAKAAAPGKAGGAGAKGKAGGGKIRSAIRLLQGLPAPDATPLIEFNDKLGGISRDVAKAAGTVHKTLSHGMGNKTLRYVHGKLNPLLGGRLPSVESLLGSVKALEQGASKAGEISDKVGKSLRRYQDTKGGLLSKLWAAGSEWFKKDTPGATQSETDKPGNSQSQADKPGGCMEAKPENCCCCCQPVTRDIDKPGDSMDPDRGERKKEDKREKEKKDSRRGRDRKERRPRSKPRPKPSPKRRPSPKPNPRRSPRPRRLPKGRGLPGGIGDLFRRGAALAKAGVKGLGNALKQVPGMLRGGVQKTGDWLKSLPGKAKAGAQGAAKAAGSAASRIGAGMKRLPGLARGGVSGAAKLARTAALRAAPLLKAGAGVTKAGLGIGKEVFKRTGGLLKAGIAGSVITVMEAGQEAWNVGKSNRGQTEKNKEYWKIGGKAGGSIGGAAMGAAIGSMILPGVGTLVGGVIGHFAGKYAGEWAGGKAGNAIHGAPMPGKAKQPPAAPPPAATQPPSRPPKVDFNKPAGMRGGGRAEVTASISVSAQAEVRARQLQRLQQGVAAAKAPAKNAGGGMNVTFAPHITVTAGAAATVKQQVQQAVQLSYAEFERLMRRYEADRQRRSYSARA